jgi:hypothetical protein
MVRFVSCARVFRVWGGQVQAKYIFVVWDISGRSISLSEFVSVNMDWLMLRPYNI